MNVHDFIDSHKEQWYELESFIRQASRLALSRVSLDVFQRGSLAYRQTISDLAFARMRFAGHPVVVQLERLVGNAHSVIYHARSGEKKSRLHFFTHVWPALIRQEFRSILVATVLFWTASLLGFGLAVEHPQLEDLFVSTSMRAALEKGELWTQHITSIAPQATSQIATNNISVSLAAWALGITLGVGTFWLITLNGLMLGVIFAACLRFGMHGELAEFVVGHGSLELPAIWIAAGAGFILGRAIVFPGRYRRSVEVQLAAKKSVQLVLGTIPMLVIAALVEGFVSPSDLPGLVKALLGAVLALGYVVYIGTGAMRK